MATELKVKLVGQDELSSSLKNARSHLAQFHKDIQTFNKTGMVSGGSAKALKEFDYEVKAAKGSLMALSTSLKGTLAHMANMSPASQNFKEAGQRVGQLREQIDKVKESMKNASKTNKELNEEVKKGSGFMNGFIGKANMGGVSLGKLSGAFALGQIGASLFMKAIQIAGQAISSLINKGKELIANGFGMAMSLEKAKTGLSVFVGSIENAGRVKGYMRQNMSEAINLFGLESMTKGVQKLMSAGDSAKNATQTMYTLANAVAAVGESGATLDRLVYQLQDINNKSKTDLIDIKQMGTAGIPILALLAESTGKTTEELRAQTITYGMITEALKEASEEGGLFQNALIKQAETLNGVLEATKNQLALMFADAFDNSGIFDLVKEGAIAFLNVLRTLAPFLIKIGMAIGVELKRQVANVMLAFNLFSGAVGKNTITLEKIAGVIAMVARVAIGMLTVAIVTAMGVITAIIKYLQMMQKAGVAMLRSVVNSIQGILNAMSSASKGVADISSNIGQSIANGIAWGVNLAIDAINALIGMYQSTIGKIPNAPQMKELVKVQAKQIERGSGFEAPNISGAFEGMLSSAQAMQDSYFAGFANNAGSVDYNIDDLLGFKDGSGAGSSADGGGGSSGVSEAQKEAEKRQKELEKMREKEAKAIEKFNEKVQKANEDYNKAEVEAREKATDDSLRLMETFVEKSGELKKKLDEGITNSMTKYREELVKLKDEAIKSTNEVRRKLAESIENTYRSQATKVSNVGDLFKGGVTGGGLLQNIMGSTERITGFTDEITKLQGTGLNSVLVNELKAQGVSAQRQVELLNQMTLEEIEQVNRAFEEQQKASRELAEKQMEEEVQALNEKAKEELNKITETFREKGEEARGKMMEEIAKLEKDYADGMLELKTETEKSMLEINETMVESIRDAKEKMLEEIKELKKELKKEMKEIRSIMDGEEGSTVTSGVSIFTSLKDKAVGVVTGITDALKSKLKPSVEGVQASLTALMGGVSAKTNMAVSGIKSSVKPVTTQSSSVISTNDDITRGILQNRVGGGGAGGKIKTMKNIMSSFGEGETITYNVFGGELRSIFIDMVSKADKEIMRLGAEGKKSVDAFNALSDLQKKIAMNNIHMVTAKKDTQAQLAEEQRLRDMYQKSLEGWSAYMKGIGVQNEQGGLTRTNINGVATFIAGRGQGGIQKGFNAQLTERYNEAMSGGNVKNINIGNVNNYDNADYDQLISKLNFL